MTIHTSWQAESKQLLSNKPFSEGSNRSKILRPKACLIIPDVLSKNGKSYTFQAI